MRGCELVLPEHLSSGFRSLPHTSRERKKCGVCLHGRIMAAVTLNSGLTRRQKRLLVQGRLAEADADTLSDRAIARELGVSQPFVSALRRSVGKGRPRRTIGADEHPQLPVSSQQGLDRFHDQTGPLGGVRRVLQPRANDEGRALRDADPFE